MTTPNISSLRGTGYKQITSPLFNRDQQNIFSQLASGVQPGLTSGLSHLSKLAGGDQSQFAQMEAPALRQFNALQGSLASRFSGMGSGARGSSGFQNTMGEAGASLAEQLQGQRLNMQQQAIAQLLGLSDSLLGKQTFQTAFVPKQTPAWQTILGGLGGIGGQIGGGLGTMGLGKWFGLI